MSAVLGPIHFWLYKKIGNQEQLTAAIAELAENNGWIKDASHYIKTLPALESVIDEGNIHGWLQAQISDAETRWADLVTEILSSDEKRLEALCAAGKQFGETHALQADSADAVYKAFDDFFVNGMPCDRINKVTEFSAQSVCWEMSQDIHAPYWNGSDAPYYAIRTSAMQGMLKGSSYTLTARDDFHYSITQR
ncbi:MAG: hypothetical protein LKE64_10050 [Solobacterium sp.]|jgi:hypothetical protein|nr:hypothetical protein [Solobacterium sp.]MCH4048434.1 hypothetical protein [Solobacterium sp.]MCH4074714.1 hypothetical protein [Solobacterium sp.]MCI1313895.1 hypothetical protein [Solobacterium sp.]MCI1346444.1 hypothetical protein [Solobacterium sp.]